jgi:iron complex outermembrane receptor protein
MRHLHKKGLSMNSMCTRLGLLSGCALLLIIPGSACAEPVAATASPADDPTAGVTDIVVTAQRREESLQKVPISVSAVSGDMAKALGVSDISSLQAVVPGLEFPRYFNNTTPALRGIGTNSAIGAQESVVALYVDDVYIASPAAATFSFNNISQVAVLKGPQGTLFGRNAMGGVVQITTRTPSHNSRLDADVGYANYDTVSGALYATTGIADNLAADISLIGSHQGDGWGKNLADGKDAFKEWYWGARSKWLLDLGDTKITLGLDYTRNKYNSGIAMRPIKGALFPNGQTYEGYYNIDEAPEGSIDTRQGGASLKIDHDFGWAQLVNIAAWRKVKSHNIADEDQTRAFSQDFIYDDNRETETEELHLNSPAHSGPLNWIVGLFYLHDRPVTDFRVRGDAIAPLPSIHQYVRWQNNSYAVFGQATYTFLDSWHLTGGARYTWDRSHFLGDTTAPELDLALDSGDLRARFQKFTYKAALQKDFSPDVMAYVSYSTGYKSGIFNFADYHSPAVRPENLDALEGGLKTQLFDRHLRLNLTGFYYWYKDLQVSTLVLVDGRTLTTLQNAASARNKGIELEAEAVPLHNLTITGALTAMHSRFDRFPGATLSLPLPEGGNTTYAGDASGLKTPHAPDFTASLGAQYRVSTGSGDFNAAVNYNYNGGFVWDADNRLKQHPYHLVNASLAWMPPSGRYEVRLWTKNLLGEKYSVYTTANIVGDEETPAPPRTFGVTLGVHLP